MEKSFQSKERGFFVEFLPNEVFKGLSKDERSWYSKYRNRHLNYHKLQKEGEEIHFQIDKLKGLLEEKKREVKKYELELFRWYDKVKHLDKNVEFLIWDEEEWRNKKECEKDSELKPKKRVVFRVEYKLGGSRMRKKISCGSWETIPQTLNGYNNKNKDYKGVSVDDLRNELNINFIGSYVFYHIYKNGYSHFHNHPHNLKKVVEWFNEYEKEYGKWEGFKWYGFNYV
jgi:hypothetical protein